MNTPRNSLVEALRLQNDTLQEEIITLRQLNVELHQTLIKVNADLSTLVRQVGPHLNTAEFNRMLETLNGMSAGLVAKAATDGPDADPTTGIPYGDLT